MRRITRPEAKAFKKRWSAVEAADVAELRATPVSRKLAQLIALMSSAPLFGDSDRRAADEAEVRARWQRLRKILRG